MYDNKSNLFVLLTRKLKYNQLSFLKKGLIEFKIIERQDGGIAVESAIMLPIFLAFVLALIMFTYISLIELALQSAVTETVKSISTQVYPVKLLMEAAKKGKDNILDNSRIEDFKNDNLFKDMLVENLPEEMKIVMNSLNSAINPTLYQTLKPVVYHYANKQLLNQNQMKIVDVKIPDLVGKSQLFFGIEVKYEFKLPVPFFNKTIIITRRAYERVWIGE